MSDDYSWENDNSSGDERTDELFNMLVSEGALVLTGMSETGEPTYAVTEKCREILPELYEQMKMDYNGHINDLWQMGIIEYRIAETNDEDMMRLSDDWMANTKKALVNDKLDSNHRSIIKGLIDSEVEALKSVSFEELSEEF